MSYLQGYGTRKTPQSEPIPGTSQVANSAGGYAWEIDDFARLRRFLILGSEGGSYYVTERELTRENVDVIVRCLRANGGRTVTEIAEISHGGRAPKNDPAIFALAAASALGDDETRRLAFSALHRVCRTGTHLFRFLGFREQFAGWGRGMRRAVGDWYTMKEPDALAYQLVKYRQRYGWSHRDALRLAKPRPDRGSVMDGILRWATHPDDMAGALDAPAAIEAFARAQAATSPRAVVETIRAFGDKLPREAIPTEYLTSPDVWDALLRAGMPMTAMIRNLATMTRVGLLTPTSDATRIVLEQLQDADRLRKARVHPIQALSALLTYKAGHGARGTNTWTPVVRIVDALDGAFYASFGNVEPTGKRWLLALDVSGSMMGPDIAGVPGLSPRVASAAMAMVTAASGDPYEVVAFTSAHGSGWSSAPALASLTISPRQRLDDVIRTTGGLLFGGTDCALPMLYAADERRDADCFVVYTDSETWAGSVHPAQALRAYRQRSGIDARLAVVGMVSNGFSIADPQDAGMLDVVGFDSAAPGVIADFGAGRI
jgi:60 kDa SS-A/Ro ribonucleoprotein